MTSYKFRSPIKANRDAVAAKLALKGGHNTLKEEKRTVTDMQLIKDEEDPSKIVGYVQGKTKEIDIYIVESDVMP